MKKFGKFKWPPLVQHQCHNCGAKFEVCLPCSRRITEDDAEFARKILETIVPKVKGEMKFQRKLLRAKLERYMDEQAKVEEELGIKSVGPGLDKDL